MTKPQLKILKTEEERKAYRTTLELIEYSTQRHHEDLDLDDLGLTALPPEVGELTWLKSLSLFNNRLTSLPTEIGHLKSLTSLDVRQNRLTNLPNELRNLSKLE